MITFQKLPDVAAIGELKERHLTALTAPMDGMWETGFINSSPHWEIRRDGERVGYYVANDEGALLQFFVLPEFESEARGYFDAIVALDEIKQAVVGTIEPTYLSFCLDTQKKAEVHTYLYEHVTTIAPDHPQSDATRFRAVVEGELEQTVQVQQACLGAGDAMAGWLYAYSSNLIARNELFVLQSSDGWIGLGELRRSDTQRGIADLGMMVHPDHRGEGWATYILRLLVHASNAENLRPICSTTVDNAGAQAAIRRSGFISRHRILNVTF